MLSIHSISKTKQRLQYECEFVETADCFNKSENVLYVERARLIRENSANGVFDMDSLDENMSQEEKLRMKMNAEAQAASASVKKWVSFAHGLKS